VPTELGSWGGGYGLARLLPATHGQPFSRGHTSHGSGVPNMSANSGHAVRLAFERWEGRTLSAGI